MKGIRKVAYKLLGEVDSFFLCIEALHGGSERKRLRTCAFEKRGELGYISLDGFIELTGVASQL